MLLEESPLIVHGSFKEWIGFIFHPHSRTARWLWFFLKPSFSSLFSLNYSFEQELLKIIVTEKSDIYSLSQKDEVL
jgi:hypothetical protein